MTALEPIQERISVERQGVPPSATGAETEAALISSLAIPAREARSALSVTRSSR